MKYHIISDNKNLHILYCDSKLAIVPIKRQMAEKLKIKEAQVPNTNDEFDSIFSKIESLPPIKTYNNNLISLRSIDRITLCVSNDCNLRCKYCYAFGGSYGTYRGLMSKAVAEKFVDFCKDNFDYINKIVFFGGEPMLNPQIIEFICKRIKEVFLAKSKQCPVFGMITNGTIHDLSLYKLFGKYISYLTISIDGPKSIQDSNRLFTNGKGSYNYVEHFIKEVVRIPGLHVLYEATLTNDAIRAGYDIVSLKRFFHNTFGIDGIIVNDSHLGKEIEIKYLSSITEAKMLDSDFECLPTAFWKILELLVKHENNTFCNIGYKIFSVTIKGELYACHLVNEKRMCNLGSITDKNLFNDTSHYANLISSSHNKDNAICKACWCKNLCGGCTIDFFYDKKNKSLKSIPNQDMCNHFRMYVESVLILITKIRTNKTLWRRLLNKLCIL